MPSNNTPDPRTPDDPRRYLVVAEVFARHLERADVKRTKRRRHEPQRRRATAGPSE